MRLDQQVAKRWVKKGNRVLDLGCGDGTLLATMVANLDIMGYGLEIDPDNITKAVSRGLSIIQQDLNLGLSRFSDQSFDVVVMAQALQAVNHPDELLLDMVRIGKEAIITFPNFAYWKTRSYLFFKGKMPVSDVLPYSWYNTPNIHLCTFKDFEALCEQHGIRVLNRLSVNDNQRGSFLMKYFPNIFGEIAIYRVTKQ